MAEEVDIIRHLLDVEHNASSMLVDSQKEADKRTSAARAKADADFKSQYSQICLKIESDEKSEKENLNSKHNEVISKFKEGLDCIPKQVEPFNNLLEKILFA